MKETKMKNDSIKLVVTDTKQSRLLQPTSEARLRLAQLTTRRNSLEEKVRHLAETGGKLEEAAGSERHAAWGDVAKNARAARLAISQAAGAARSGPAAAGLGGGGGGGRHRPGWLGGGGGGAHIPGGGFHLGGGGAMATAGLVGYGVYQAAEMEDAVFQLIYHSGLEQNDASRKSFRTILQDAMATSGYGLKDVAEAAKQEIRMFQGTKGGGLDVLPEMLRAATIESRLKGESPE
jgi:hypothetical protein